LRSLTIYPNRHHVLACGGEQRSHLRLPQLAEECRSESSSKLNQVSPAPLVTVEQPKYAWGSPSTVFTENRLKSLHSSSGAPAESRLQTLHCSGAPHNNLPGTSRYPGRTME